LKNGQPLTSKFSKWGGAMKFILLLLAALFPLAAHAEEKVVYIYQDADLTNHKESSISIQKGIEVAFAEINDHIAGYMVKFKYLDHRGNVIRSKRNYQKFIDDPKALAIYSGVHSPPLIKNLSFINKNKALTLVPWAAGAPITRYPSSENWIFRLSLDDTRVGSVIVDFAIKEKKCRQPHLLLEKTPWGHSNFKNMSLALKKYDIDLPTVTHFGWSLSKSGARSLIRNISNSGNDCIILVSSAIEGASIVEAMLKLPANKRLPIISHWGITGGNFHEKITKEKREHLDLHFIHSCFSFINPNQSDLAKSVFQRLKNASNGTINQAQDLRAAVGFIHAYDLTKLLIKSIQQTGLSGNIIKDRNAVRLALENIKSPVQGLIKTYAAPFSQFNAQTNINAHEALNKNDYCIAKYGNSDEVLVIQREPK